MSGVGQDSVPDHVIEVLDVAGGPTDCRLHEPSQVYYREIQRAMLGKPGRVYYREIQRAMLSHFRRASAQRKQIVHSAPAGEDFRQTAMK